jgi:hypothetical protein
MTNFTRNDLSEELRRLKEDLPLAIKRAAEAFRADPTKKILITSKPSGSLNWRSGK